MKSNQERRKEIFKGVLPESGSKEYFDAIEHLKKEDENNPRIKDFVKEQFKKARISFEAQYLSHCDLITEKTLRHFLKEFNFRAWNHGLRSMPLMFNILESFFVYIKPTIYFELIEEENYLISLFDFLDYITSKEFSNNKKDIEDNLTNNLIFNFNIGNDAEKIKFKTSNNEEFIIVGISIVRRNNEVTILLNTGKKVNAKSTLDVKDFNFGKNPNKTELIQDFNKNNENQAIETEFIDKEKQYAKYLVACRIDLETETVDARYVAEEHNSMFTIITDDIDGFVDINGEFKSEGYKNFIENSIEKISSFDAIIEIAKISMYIPLYLNLNEDNIYEESHETEFHKENKNPISKRKFRNSLGYKTSLKPLYVLNNSDELKPDFIKLRDDLFKIKTTGYWKKIENDEIGLDKNGNTIHGKTWVNNNLSWFQAKTDELIVQKENNKYTGENSGYIYILRNPIMGKNIFKIGLTRNDVDERIKQLSNTSVPDKFYKSQEWNVKDCIKAEKEIHLRLTDYRIDKRREFFNVEYDKAISVIFEVVNEINRQ